MVHGWLAEQVCNYSGPVDVLTDTKPGEEVTLSFEGTMLGIHAIVGMDAGVLEISVDEHVFTEKCPGMAFSSGLTPAAFRDPAAGWVAFGLAAPFARILEVSDPTPEELAAAGV